MAGRCGFYVGRAGQMVVMAEFLRRGYNAAVPEIDRGDDIFVIEDATGKLSRIQVKSAAGKGTNHIWANFSILRKQLETVRQPELWYVFTVYYRGLWREFLVIRRDRLQELRDLEGVGKPMQRRDAHLNFYIAFHEHDVLCGGVSLQQYRHNWDAWPEIQP
jgi:hypothetical protein